METKESIPPQIIMAAGKADAHQDVKCLWDRWDKAQKEEAPSDLVKGVNLVGVGMIIAGSLFQTLGSGVLKYQVAPIVIVIGAAIIAVKKFRALWLQRSVDS